ncbi:hypothetical protein CVT24_008951 [Panaeolus cyanescens]|uniref:D-lactate dehydrogenase (cytochrome) n=1 Tax=Panaeolus cyanescens TaxID=181874 RepID=A0A409YAV8_9AGAR|nr:hypothetical protein CVT24_008951 [Panaeolus cyanescens]
MDHDKTYVPSDYDLLAIELQDWTDTAPLSHLSKPTLSPTRRVQPPWHPRLTVYRFLVILSTFALGVAKYVATRKDLENETIALEWVLGVGIFIVLYILGLFEDTKSPKMRFLHQIDCLDLFWRYFLQRGRERTRSYMTVERKPTWTPPDPLKPDYFFDYPKLTGYRLLVTVVVAGVGMAKATFSYMGWDGLSSGIECGFGTIASVGCIGGLVNATLLPQRSLLKIRALTNNAPGNKRHQSRNNLDFSGLVLALSLAAGIGYSAGRQAMTAADVEQRLAPTFGSPTDFERAIEELHAALPKDSVSTDPDELQFHGVSANDYHPSALHSVVVYPTCTEDVVKVVHISRKYKMPVVPFSGGTSLEGHFRGHTVGGICIDLNKMDRILEIHEKDSDLVCQPAARWMDINETLRRKGIPLFFPIDPGPGATVGGMLSTGCSGTNAVKYGTAKGEWFLNVTVVLPSGEVIKTRRRARKSAAGFDLTKLFIGAEGTLGIITEVTIRLAPVQPTNVAVVHFPDVKSATEASIDILNQGAGIQCVELLDQVSMKAINNYGMSIRKWPEKDSLFLKMQGSTHESLQETAKIVEHVTKRHGGTGFSLARNEKEAHDLWADRKNIYYAGLSLVEGSRGLTTDVCVPISNLPELVAETKKDLESLGIVSSVVGHVGDGNFHAMLLFTNDEELAVAKAASHRIVKRAIALDGTCTGEHGVGIGKKMYLTEELGGGTVELMKTIKRAIDPQNLFNPGKLYPDDPPLKNANDKSD